MLLPPSPLARLGAFRTELRAYTLHSDALLDLTDALLCAPAVLSVVHLSLEPAHGSGWGSAYAVLASGCIDASGSATCWWCSD